MYMRKSEVNLTECMEKKGKTEERYILLIPLLSGHISTLIQIAYIYIFFVWEIIITDEFFYSVGSFH